jgi:hypothetical protein
VTALQDKETRLSETTVAVAVEEAAAVVVVAAEATPRVTLTDNQWVVKHQWVNLCTLLSRTKEARLLKVDPVVDSNGNRSIVCVTRVRTHKHNIFE